MTPYTAPGTMGRAPTTTLRRHGVDLDTLARPVLMRDSSRHLGEYLTS